MKMVEYSRSEDKIKPTKMASGDVGSISREKSPPLISHKALTKARDVQEQEVGVANSGRLKVDRLLSILKGYGEYPSKYRYLKT